MNMNQPYSDPADPYKARRLNPAIPTLEEEEESIDLRGLFMTLWRGKWIIVICSLISALLGFLASSQSDPVYRASAKVMFGLQQTNVVNMQEVVAEQQYGIRELEDQIQVLRSTVLIEKVVDDLRLDEDPEFNPFLRVPEPTFFEKAGAYVSFPPEVTEIARNIGLLTPPPPPRHAAETRHRERLAVVQNVSQRLGLVPVGQSRVIEISFLSGNPNTAASVANSVAEQYIQDQLKSELQAFRSATSWLSTRVEELRVRVQKAEAAIEQARSEMSAETGQSLEITESQLAAVNGALSQTRVNVARTQALYDRLTEALEEGRDLGAISQFRSSAIIQNYRSQESQLLDQRAEVAFTFSGDNPELRRIDQKLERVRENIAYEASQIVEAAELDLRAAKLEEQALREELRRLEDKAFEQAGDQLQLRQLEREADASRILYENFLNRLQETNAQQDLQEADARILTPAERPLSPQRQTERRTQLIATVLGAMVGVGIVFLLERLNNAFRSSDQLEEVTGETVLGTLPSIGRKLQRADIIRRMREKPGSSLVEAVRNLRTSILFSNIDDLPKIVMFTSSVPREGKSTTSMLVAMTSQQMGKSAIIVDCDLRLPQLAGIV
ncbi:MAG: exopolysaccharide transport family protein, partial [Roseobacter sp.]|nr:exopolysaccharide transport family protein [Roseobacter sp.]